MRSKANLEELGLPTNLGEIKAMSQHKFKTLVKKKARDFEFQRFVDIKEKRCKSKMKNLLYTSLKMQDYLHLENINPSQAKAIFKFCVRIAPFGENFRGGQQTVVCPLCKLHPDGQEESFSCVKVKQIIEVRGNYKEIFGWKFSPELIKTVHNTYSFGVLE